MAERVEIYDTCALIDSSRGSVKSVSKATDEKKERKKTKILDSVICVSNSNVTLQSSFHPHLNLVSNEQTKQTEYMKSLHIAGSI